ncbi:MAG: DUF4411 family protein [Thermoguttaceae bacterium]
MAEQTKFLLDANVLMEAHKRYYSFDLCPGFWKAMILQHQAGRIFSIDRVKQEIAEGKDKLHKWTLQKLAKTFFKKTDRKSIIECFTQIVLWVQSEVQYKLEAKAEFAKVADGWLIACANPDYS